MQDSHKIYNISILQQHMMNHLSWSLQNYMHENYHSNERAQVQHTHTHTHTYVYYQTIEDFVFHQLTEDIISRTSSNTGLPTQLRTMSCCVRMSYLSPRPRTSG